MMQANLVGQSNHNNLKPIIHLISADYILNKLV